MNWTKLLFLLSLIMLVGCTKEEDTSEHLCDTPVLIDELRINSTVVEDLTDFENLILLVDRDTSFRIDFTLSDDSNIEYMELFVLVNNELDKKHNVIGPQDPSISEMSYAYTAESFEMLYLENMTHYTTEIGDRLHFYLRTQDDTIHDSEFKFTLELQ